MKRRARWAALAAALGIALAGGRAPLWAGEEAPYAETETELPELWEDDEEQILEESLETWDIEEALPVGDVSSQDAGLIEDEDASLVLAPVGETKVEAAPGSEEPIVLEVAWTGAPDARVSLQWSRYVYGSESGFLPIEGEQGQTLTVTAQGRIDYLCAATDQYGNRAEVQFSVSIDNNLEALAAQEGVSEVTWRVPFGQTVRMEVTYTADDPEGVCLEWYWGYLHVGENAASYQAVVTQNETYKCRVTDAYGNEEEVIFHLLVDDGIALAGSVDGLSYYADRENNAVFVVVPEGHEQVTLRMLTGGDSDAALTFAWADEAGRELGQESFVTVDTGVHEIGCTVTCQDWDEDAVYMRFFLTSQAQLAAAQPLAVGEAQHVTVTEEDAERVFSLRPGANTRYRIFAAGDTDTELLLLDSQGRYLLYNDEDEEGDEDDNFSVTVPLSGDTLYYLKTFLWGHDHERAAYRVSVLEDETAGHVWDEGTVTTAPTCVSPGVKTFTCLADPSHTRTQALPATGVHTPVTDPAVPATTTSKGRTEGSHCAVCGAVLTAQQTIPKLPRKEQPMSASGRTVTVKASALEKKARTVAAEDTILIKKAKGEVTCLKKSGHKKITVSSSGKITLKKGLKKGTYKVKIKVRAAGNASYKAGSRTVTVKIKVI